MKPDRQKEMIPCQDFTLSGNSRSGIDVWKGDRGPSCLPFPTFTVEDGSWQSFLDPRDSLGLDPALDIHSCAWKLKFQTKTAGSYLVSTDHAVVIHGGRGWDAHSPLSSFRALLKSGTGLRVLPRQLDPWGAGEPQRQASFEDQGSNNT